MWLDNDAVNDGHIACCQDTNGIVSKTREKLKYQNMVSSSVQSTISTSPNKSSQSERGSSNSNAKPHTIARKHLKRETPSDSNSIQVQIVSSLVLVRI